MNELKPLIIFDMDGVLVENRSSWRIIHEALGTSNEDSFKAYIRGEIDDEEFMRRDIRRWLTSKPDLSISHIRKIYSKVKRTEGIEELFSGIGELGGHSTIISGGIDLLSSTLMKDYNIDSQNANGIEEENGKLTGEGILRVPLRDKGSVIDTVLKRIGPHAPIISVGDSMVDITMFKKSDLSIAFDPDIQQVSDEADVTINDRDLRKVLKEIIDFLS
jgi:phosphoserine phosphatase